MKRPTRQESRPVSQATELPYRFLPFFRSGRCQNGRSRWTKSLKLRKTLHVADYGGACRKVFTKSCSRHQHLAAIEAQDVAFPGLEQAPAPMLRSWLGRFWLRVAQCSAKTEHDGSPLRASLRQVFRLVRRLGQCFLYPTGAVAASNPTEQCPISLQSCASRRRALPTAGFDEWPNRGKLHRSWLGDGFGTMQEYG